MQVERQIRTGENKGIGSKEIKIRKEERKVEKGWVELF
jgi:hypothetical protein